jgi:vacuolar protein sorting-associated protein 13A/C
MSNYSAKSKALQNLPNEGESKIYIAKLKLSPIEVVLSFLGKTQSEGTLLGQTGTLSKAIGVAITNIEESTIKMNAMELEHVFGGTSDVLNKIYDYYSENFLNTALRLIGSIDFLGNPIKFFGAITTGIKDFFYKPIEGYVEGPIQGPRQGPLVGLYKGTTSLVKNTLLGTFGSISKITSSWSKGLLILTCDEDFMSRREARFIKEKAGTFADGLGYGITSAFKSFKSGVEGIVVQPFEGARKHGIKGFAKGVGLGISGSIIKTVSGALDLVARTSEGGKNTTSLFEFNEEKPIRKPRAFYTKFEIVT